MKTCVFDDKELELIDHVFKLLQSYLRNDLDTFIQKSDLPNIQHCIDDLSLIDLILPKFKI